MTPLGTLVAPNYAIQGAFYDNIGSALAALNSGLDAVNGRINDLPPARRGTAMMFQSYALFPHLTCVDNVAFSLKLKGISKPERRAKAMDRSLGVKPGIGRWKSNAYRVGSAAQNAMSRWAPSRNDPSGSSMIGGDPITARSWWWPSAKSAS